MKIRIGSRKSKLALIQTNLVIEKINKEFPNITCEIVPIVTSGDKITNKNLYDIGGKALFLKELEEQLLAGNIDMAMHSLKDVPGILPDGLSIAAVLEREDPRDALISLKYSSVDEIPAGAIIGTSSVRRKVIIEKINPHIEIIAFRGNINTRLEKLKSGEADATILALAGLRRAGLFDDSYCHTLSTSQMLPAVGQGIIAVEICQDNQKMQEICAKINHQPTWHLAKAERSFLSYLDASCRTPISAHAVYADDKIKAEYMLSDFDGSFMSHHTEIADVKDADQMGVIAAKAMGV